MGLWGGLQEWRVAPGGWPARKQGLQSSNDKENSASSWVSVDCPSRAQPGPQMGTQPGETPSRRDSRLCPQKVCGDLLPGTED